MTYQTTTPQPEPPQGARFVTVTHPDGSTRTDLKRLTDGRVMCCLCFAYAARDQLAPDPEHPGCVTDVCLPCALREARAALTQAREIGHRLHERPIARAQALADTWADDHTPITRAQAAELLYEVLDPTGWTETEPPGPGLTLVTTTEEPAR